MPKPDRNAFRYYQPPAIASSAWTVDRVQRALRMHDDGDFSESGLLFEQIERNPRTQAALNTRELGLLGLPFAIQPAERNATRSTAAARELTTLWPRIAPEKVTGEMLRALVVMGVAIAEIVWTLTATKWVPEIRPVHPSLIRWAEYGDGAGRFEVLTTTGYVPVTEGDGRWLVLSARRTRGWIRGVIRCLGVPDAIRGYAVRDWARWSEKHGLPILLAKVPQSENDDADQAFADSLADLGNESTLILPQVKEADGPSFDADLLEAKSLSWEGFKELLAQVDEDTAIAILGQNLTTKVSGGSLAAANSHEKIRQDYKEADAEQLSTAIHNDVMRPWALYNRGSADLAPWAIWDPTPPADTKALADTWDAGSKALTALLQADAPVDERAYLEKLGVPLLTAEEHAAKLAEKRAQGMPQSTPPGTEPGQPPQPPAQPTPGRSSTRDARANRSAHEDDDGLTEQFVVRSFKQALHELRQRPQSYRA